MLRITNLKISLLLIAISGLFLPASVSAQESKLRFSAGELSPTLALGSGVGSLNSPETEDPVVPEAPPEPEWPSVAGNIVVTDTLFVSGNASYNNEENTLQLTDGSNSISVGTHDGLLTSANDFIDFTLTAPSDIGIYSARAANIRLVYKNGNITDFKGDFSKKTDYQLLSVAANTEARFKYLLPAGDYSMRLESGSSLAIREITAYAVSEQGQDVNLVPVTITDYSTVNANYGRAEAWTDGSDSLVNAYDAAYLTNGANFVEFTINEPADIGFFNVHNSSSVGAIRLSATTGSILALDGGLGRKGTQYIPLGRLAETRLGYALPAGTYRITHDSSNAVQISEIRAYTMPEKPALPAGQVEVVIDDFATVNANYGRRDAWTDGANTLANTYDGAYLNSGANFVEFRINEPADIGFFNARNSGNVGAIRLSAKTGSILALDGGLGRKGTQYIPLGRLTETRLGYALPAGTYRITNDHTYSVDISEIRAYVMPEKPALPAGQVEVIIDDFATINADYGRRDAWTDGASLLANTYDGAYLNSGSHFVEFTINEPADIGFFNARNSSNVGAIRLSAKTGSILALDGGLGRKGTQYIPLGRLIETRLGYALPAGTYRITNDHTYSVDISEIRAYVMPEKPALPAGQVEVVIDDFVTVNDSYGRRDAWTDGASSLANTYDGAYLTNSSNYVEFTIAEPADIGFFNARTSTTLGSVRLLFMSGDTTSPAADIIPSGGEVLTLGRTTETRLGRKVIAGTYRIQSSSSAVDVSEIRAYR